MSATPWRGTLIFAGTIAAVAATAGARFAEVGTLATASGGGQAGGTTSAASPAGGSSSSGSSSGSSSAASSGSSSAADPATTPATDPAGTTDPATTPAPAAPATSDAVTVVGDAVQTRYGAVQVSVTFAGSDITAVEALQSPGGHRESQAINAYALPILAQEAVAADSASIDAVTGATVTSGAYRQSLQSAIDQRG